MTDLLAYTVTGLCAYFAVALPIAVLLGRMMRADRRMFSRESPLPVLPVYNTDGPRPLAFDRPESSAGAGARPARAVAMAR